MQLVEMTGRSEEDVVVALHDAQDDAALAVSILLDDEQGQVCHMEGANPCIICSNDSVHFPSQFSVSRWLYSDV